MTLAMVVVLCACGSGDVETTTTTPLVETTATPTTTEALLTTTTAVPTTTTSEAPPATTPTTDETEATGPTITSGGVSITLPAASWVGADVADGPAGVGAVIFPDDPDRWEAAENVVGLLPRAVTLFGLDASRLDQMFVDNLNVLIDASVPPGMDFAEMVEAEAQGIELVGGSVLITEIIALGGREVGRAVSDLGEYSVFSYFLVEDETTYVITYSYDSITDANLMAANGSVATFSVD
jgi:hypothetical protein